MTSKKFIEKELRLFVEKFPQVRVRYEFHAMSEVHLVEVLPIDIYSQNEDYINWESSMWDRFVEKYPRESICFISEDAVVDIENAELTLFGDKYITYPNSTYDEGFTIDPATIIIQHVVSKAPTKITFTQETTKSNSIWSIFPYIREHITSLSLKAGIGAIILPPVNFTKNKNN